MKDKKDKTVLNVFIKIVNASNSKPSKLWVDQERKFYKKLMQKWFDNDDIFMYPADEGKSIITERFMKTVKPEIYGS